MLDAGRRLTVPSGSKLKARNQLSYRADALEERQRCNGNACHDTQNHDMAASDTRQEPLVDSNFGFGSLNTDLTDISCLASSSPLTSVAQGGWDLQTDIERQDVSCIRSSAFEFLTKRPRSGDLMFPVHLRENLETLELYQSELEYPEVRFHDCVAKNVIN